MNKRTKNVAILRERERERESSNLKNGKIIKKLMSNDVGVALQGDPLKQNTAITLIALVITIIVLLILAGVSLSLVMGENGIIAKAKQAKDRTNQAQTDEETQIANYNNQIDEYVTSARTSIEDIFENSQLVADLTTAQTGTRQSDVSVSFEAEANTEYYMFGHYVCTGGSNKVDIFANAITEDFITITLGNAEIIKKYEKYNTIKIKSNNSGTVNISINTMESTNNSMNGRLYLKIYKL